jgi:Xaa-Pro dipeptidase
MTLDLQTETPSIFPSRQQKLAQALQAAGLDALVLNPGPSLVYLTGLSFHLMERPLVAVFFPDHPPLLILPELEAARAAALPFPCQVITFNDNPATWTETYDRAARQAGIDGQRVGLEPRRLRVLELRLLEGSAPRANFVSAEDHLSALRIQKDAGEMTAIRKAVEIAQLALTNTLGYVKVGMTELELASELSLQILRAGSQPEFPFAPIVSFGPNSANPHSVPGTRRLAPGDLLLIDWGAAYQDYISDLTRTFAAVEVDAEFANIARIVAEANAAGRQAARPGVPAGEVDRAARAVIEAAGYGPQFIHRLGHGIGLEAHEGPYMYGESQLLLAPGMTFTVEPGIYLPGRGGVRIEDNVVITTYGSETLSHYPRNLVVIG